MSKWEELLHTHAVASDMSKFTAHFESQDFPNPVIIDCTASAQVSQMYYEWINKGIHVVTPNKKANSGAFDQVHPRLYSASSLFSLVCKDLVYCLDKLVPHS